MNTVCNTLPRSAKVDIWLVAFVSASCINQSCLQPRPADSCCQPQPLAVLCITYFLISRDSAPLSRTSVIAPEDPAAARRLWNSGQHSAPQGSWAAEKSSAKHFSRPTEERLQTAPIHHFLTLDGAQRPLPFCASL